jgi:membrane associated rhomboid family serine protease
MQRGAAAQIIWPRPGRVLLSVVVANVVLYVLQLILLRAGAQGLVEALYLSPREVLEGRVWQLFTYAWLHSPVAPSHLLFNMLLLYSFGARLERWWGAPRFLRAYVLFAVAGGLASLAFGALAYVGPLAPLFSGVLNGPHLGASGAVMGMVIAFGLTHGDEQVALLLGPPMKARTLVWVVVGIDLLVALSFSPVSSSSHLGGMLASVILCRGLWRPSAWGRALRRVGLAAKRRRIEAELRVIEGGRGGAPRSRAQDDPKNWS